MERARTDISWWLTSMRDPRWNISGRDRAGPVTDLDEVPSARSTFDQLCGQYGYPPEDLQFGCQRLRDTARRTRRPAPG